MLLGSPESSKRQLIHYPVSLQAPSGPSSSECYSQERAIPGGQGTLLGVAQGQDRFPVPAATWPQTPHRGPAQPQGLSQVAEQSSSCFSRPGGSELWGAWFAALRPPLNTLQVCWPQGSRRKVPLLATGQALYSSSVPYPDWKYFGKADDFMSR